MRRNRRSLAPPIEPHGHAGVAFDFPVTAADGDARAELDGAFADLSAGARQWAALSSAQRREVLLTTVSSVAAEADVWVETACRVKGLDPQSALAGEEWLTGPYAVLAALHDYAATLAALADGRSPVDGRPLTDAPAGRRAVEVLPRRWTDRLLLSGFRVRVWMPPGVLDAEISTDAGLASRYGAAPGVGVVLGAGNITSIPVLDVLYELLANGRASLLKLNPITDPLRPVLDQALEPLIRRGVLSVRTGSAAVGERLVHHPAVGHVHLTGSAATYRAIAPGLSVPVTAELGGVSPIIVVPGRWTRRDLEFQAAHVATMRLHNNGYNCIAGQVVVLSSDWPQAEQFLTLVREAIRTAPVRPAYYPGSDDRLAAAAAEYPGAARLGERLVIPDAGRGTADRTEYFAPVLAVHRMAGLGAAFLRSAIVFANEQLTGNLGANVLIAPRSRGVAGSRFDALLAELRYGTIAVNAWTGVGFATPGAPWGAYPAAVDEIGSDSDSDSASDSASDSSSDSDSGSASDIGSGSASDMGSGIGVVHNALLLSDPERTVVEGPFRPFPRTLLHGGRSLMPRPPWFVDNRTARTTARRMTKFAADGALWRLPGILWSALRG